MAAFITATPITTTSRQSLSRCHLSNTVCVATRVEKDVRSKRAAQVRTYRVIDDPNESALPPPPPVHYSVPVIGSTIENMLGLAESSSRTDRYGPIWRSNFDFMDVVWVGDLGALHEVMSDKGEVFSFRSNNEAIGALFGTHSHLLKSTPEHREARASIAPAFQSSMFSSYFPYILAATERLWARLSDEVQSKKVLLGPNFQHHYESIIIQLTSGVDAQSPLCAQVAKDFNILMNGIIGGPLFAPSWKRSMRAKDRLTETLRNIMKKKLTDEADIIARLRENKEGMKDVLKSGGDIMQVVLAHADDTEDPAFVDAFIDTIRLLWLAGYITSAITTLSATFQMGMDESGEIMRRLVAEQDALMQEAGSRRVTHDQVMKGMPLLESYITEILRLFPAAQGVSRMVEKDVVLLGKTVKKDTTVCMDMIGAMRDENVYEDAKKIKIDRFLPQEGKNPPPQIATFGGKGSAHYCVGAGLAGMLMRTNIAVLLRDYVLDLEPNQSRRYRVQPDYTPQSQGVLRSLRKRVF